MKDFVTSSTHRFDPATTAPASYGDAFVSLSYVNKAKDDFTHDVVKTRFAVSFY